MVNVKFVILACAAGIVLLAASIATSYTIAQQAPATKSNPDAPAAAKPAPAPKAAAPKAATPADPAAAKKEQPSVSIEQVLYLVRSTLLTLNDANHSGNYTVLRDLAAPGFQARNTAADLASAFTDLRRRNFDLYGAALLPPQLTAAPALDAENRLHLTGFIPTRPLQINFDLLYEVADGQWRLFGISIATPEAPALQAQTQAPAAKQNAPRPKNP
jgi:hypothetical protein